MWLCRSCGSMMQPFKQASKIQRPRKKHICDALVGILRSPAEELLPAAADGLGVANNWQMDKVTQSARACSFYSS